MEIAGPTRFDTAKRQVKSQVKSYDATIVLGYTILALLLLIAIYLDWTASGTARDFALMAVFP